MATANFETMDAGELREWATREMVDHFTSDQGFTYDRVDLVQVVLILIANRSGVALDTVRHDVVSEAKLVAGVSIFRNSPW